MHGQQNVKTDEDLFLQVKDSLEICAVLGVFALRRMIACFGATCRACLQTSSSPRLHHPSTLRKIPKECRSHLHRSGSLKLRNGSTSLEMSWEKCISMTADGGRKTDVVGRLYGFAGTGTVTV